MVLFPKSPVELWELTGLYILIEYQSYLTAPTTYCQILPTVPTDESLPSYDSYATSLAHVEMTRGHMTESSA
jgi:hypothetical protein